MRKFFGIILVESYRKRGAQMSWWFWPLLGIIISEVAHIIVRVIRYNIMEREVMRYEHINVFLRIRTAENVDY